MKQIKNWMFAAILLLSGQMTLTSCEKVIVDTVDGIFKPLNDEADEYNSRKRQEMMDALLNWNVGTSVDQEAIDQYGLDNCFQVTLLTPEFWSSEYAPDASPAVNKDNLCLVHCLTNSSYGIRIGGIVCDKRIASDLVDIFRQLYDSAYSIQDATTAHGYCKENLINCNCTYSYFFNASDPESATTMEQQGLCVMLNAAYPLTVDDPAIILFKQHGFQWGGDMPNGNTNYFEKCL